MKFAQHGAWLLGICASLVFSSPAHAGVTCDWLGIGCEGAAASTDIDQNNPPDVFSFTVSGTFSNWADIKPETFVCDTRKREDRVCMWQKYIPEIKRDATLILEPFAHDQGMYTISGFLANRFGKDPAFSGKVGVMQKYEGTNFLNPIGQMSITLLSQTPVITEFRPSNHRGEVDFKAPALGTVTLTFKDVLK